MMKNHLRGMEKVFLPVLGLKTNSFVNTHTHILEAKATCVHTYALPLYTHSHSLTNNTYFCSSLPYPRRLATTFIFCVQQHFFH